MIDDRIILVVVRRLIVGYTYVFIITNMDFRIILLVLLDIYLMFSRVFCLFFMVDYEKLFNLFDEFLFIQDKSAVFLRLSFVKPYVALKSLESMTAPKIIDRTNIPKVIIPFLMFPLKMFDQVILFYSRNAYLMNRLNFCSDDASRMLWFAIDMLLY